MSDDKDKRIRKLEASLKAEKLLCQMLRDAAHDALRLAELWRKRDSEAPTDTEMEMLALCREAKEKGGKDA